MSLKPKEIERLKKAYAEGAITLKGGPSWGTKTGKQ